MLDRDSPAPASQLLHTLTHYQAQDCQEQAAKQEVGHGPYVAPWGELECGQLTSSSDSEDGESSELDGESGPAKGLEGKEDEGEEF